MGIAWQQAIFHLAEIREVGGRSLRSNKGLAGGAILWAGPEVAGNVAGVRTARQDGATPAGP